MRMNEYFQNLPVGEVVNKRGLAYLKRLGFIWDYSPWGYLESLHIFGKKPEGERWADEWWLEISQNRACKGAEELDYSEMTHDDMLAKFGHQGYFVFNGIKFRPKYFDGCFKPYLVKDGPTNGSEVHHRFAFPAGVC